MVTPTVCTGKTRKPPRDLLTKGHPHKSKKDYNRKPKHKGKHYE